jgi:hypothetical protein
MDVAVNCRRGYVGQDSEKENNSEANARVTSRSYTLFMLDHSPRVIKRSERILIDIVRMRLG